ncbi:hypothetical protein PIB30_108043, partial [Stylosanthes scabra]|nr:hypothetical protein [Stylosanthes scabra]
MDKHLPEQVEENDGGGRTAAVAVLAETGGGRRWWVRVLKNFKKKQMKLSNVGTGGQLSGGDGGTATEGGGGCVRRGVTEAALGPQSLLLVLLRRWVLAASESPRGDGVPVDGGGAVAGGEGG